MAKTLFGSSEKSNFILNMDLDRYRNACAKLMLIMLWVTAGAQGINQLTYRANAHFTDMIAAGGGALFIGLLGVMLRSVAALFSVMGVLVLIFAVIGLMRKQIRKSAAVPYGLLLGMLLWAAASLYCSYDRSVAFFGQDGRDEGWFALLIYAALFYLGSQLRRREQQESLLRGVMIFGIVQGVWGILQALPFGGFASQYVMLEPLLYDNLRLPSGMTDSPVTYAVLLGMLGCLSVPAELRADQKKTRICAVICRCLTLIMALKTQTVAGIIAAVCIAVMTLAFLFIGRKNAGKKAVMMPALLLGTVLLGGLWTYFTPAVNGAYNTADDSKLPNGFALYDGGIVWDDGYYRLGTAGAYSPQYAQEKSQFEVRDAGSVLAYCRAQGIAAVKIDPLLGVGPDNFYFTQLHRSYQISENPNAIDRPYNDYLYVAATRGIPSLIAQAWLVLWCLALAWKRRKQSGGWGWISAAGAVVSYALTMTAGISVLTAAPLFWIMLGTLAAEPVGDGSVSR